MQMQGVFSQENLNSLKTKRSRFLNHNSLPLSKIPITLIPSIHELVTEKSLVEAHLNLYGMSHFRLDYLPEDQDYLQFGETIGKLIPELHPTPKKFTDSKYILNLVTSIGNITDRDLAPFSSSCLSLHTESSGNSTFNQTSLLVFLAIKANGSEFCPQTVLQPINYIVDKLSSKDIEILTQTAYKNSDSAHTILEHHTNLYTLRFRDFLEEQLHWQYSGNCTEYEVNEALENLLYNMYDPSNAFHISWKTGDLIILSNLKYMHGRSSCLYSEPLSIRHLKRLRISNSALLRNTLNLNQHPLDADVNPSTLSYSPQREKKLFCTTSNSSTYLEKSDNQEFDSLKLSLTPANPSTNTNFASQIIDESTLDFFSRVSDLSNPFEIHDLWLGRSESLLNKNTIRPDLVKRWKGSKIYRDISAEEVLSNPSTVKFVKLLFNTYFRDHLYGTLRSEKNFILSSGAVNEESFGLPIALKSAINYSLSRDWYGYSDSRGRDSARSALAEYASEYVQYPSYYNEDNVAITMGATHAISSLATFILANSQSKSPCLCVLPNYPPLIQSISNSAESIRLIPSTHDHNVISLKELKAALSTDTPLVFLQTVSNPSGFMIDDDELNDIIESSNRSTIFILDECHEWLGIPPKGFKSKLHSNVVRVSSLSKQWSAPGLKIGWILADSNFISSYYEYASTSYGGPPSIFYTLIEVLSKFELYRLKNKQSLDINELKSYQSDYNLDLTQLNQSYLSYICEIKNRNLQLCALSRYTNYQLSQSGILHNPPEYSINMELLIPQYKDSYTCFRDLLLNTGVSLYPSILLYQFCAPQMRLTYTHSPSYLRTALNKLISYLNQHEAC